MTLKALNRPLPALTVAFFLALAFFVAATATASASIDRLPSVLVKVKDRAAAAKLAKEHNLRIRRSFPDIKWVEFVPGPRKAGEGRASAAERLALAELRESPAAGSIDLMKPGEEIEFQFIPTDPIFASTSTLGALGLSPPDSPIAWHFNSVNFPRAWDVTRGSSSVRIAIIDSEFNTNNPDLRDKFVSHRNVAIGTAQYGGPDVSFKPGDVGHGSHVAGLAAAATNNGRGSAGACADCLLIPIKIGGQSAGTSPDASAIASIVEGIGHAIASGAAVINMSLGFNTLHQSFQDAVNHAVARNVVVVGSAGNQQQERPGDLNYPATFPNVIGVAATKPPSNEVTNFSLHGSHVDVAAPGESIASTIDPNDQSNPGLNFWFGSDQTTILGVKDGTSMATPIVAGLAGLMKSVRPDLTPGEVKALMQQTATDVGAPGLDPIYGAGVIDAYRAVTAAQAYVRPQPPPPPPPPPAAKRVKTKVGLKVKKKAKFRYSGLIVTKAKRCRAKRSVQLRRANGKVISRAKTNKRGRFVFKRRGKVRGKVYVTVSKANRANLVCAASRTKKVRG